MTEPVFDNLEREHLIGYSGQYLNTVLFHPQDPNIFLYNIGGLVIIENINDRN